MVLEHWKHEDENSPQDLFITRICGFNIFKLETKSFNFYIQYLHIVY